MANVAHSTLSGSNLHENKGVATASDNTVATASSGSTVWQKLTASHLTGTGNSFGGQLFHIREQANSGGSSPTGNLSASGWTKRLLSTSVTNEITSSSLGSSSITLPAGTYFVKANAMLYVQGTVGASVQHAFHKIRLRDVTNNVTVVNGRSYTLKNLTSGQSIGLTQSAEGEGRFTLAGTATLELQHFVASGWDVNQGGVGVNASENEIYAEVFIWKVG